MLAETDDAVVAPARSHRRWNAGRGIFSPLRGSAIEPVMTTVLPASGASAATSGGQVLVEHVEVDAELAQARRSRRASGAVEVRVQADAATFGPDVLDLLRAPPRRASATSSSDAKPARQSRAAVPSEAIGIARPISARRRPTPRLRVDRLDHAVGARPRRCRSNSSSCSRVSA